jgi:hypothetical protein
MLRHSSPHVHAIRAEATTLAHLMGYICLQSRFAVSASCQDKGINSHGDQCDLEY